VAIISDSAKYTPLFMMLNEATVEFLYDMMIQSNVMMEFLSKN
jgi:hypothetical protein